MQFTLKLVVKLLILSQKTIEDLQSQSQASNFQLSHVRDERHLNRPMKLMPISLIFCKKLKGNGI